MASLIALDPQTYRPHTYELPLAAAGDACICTFRALPGTRGAQLIVLDTESPFRIEIAVGNPERHRIELKRGDGGRISIRPQSPLEIDYCLLPVCDPTDTRRLSQPLLPPAEQPGDLGIAILVDGTAQMLREHADRQSGAGGSEEQPVSAWTGHVGQLVTLIEGISRGAQRVHYLVMGYGDRALPYATALDLKPTWDQPLWPRSQTERRRFRVFQGERLRSDLMRIHYTPGGDFIDELGEGLRECNRLNWDGFARRVLIVTGDSPGFSLVYELSSRERLPPGANGALQRYDVDTQLLRLHNARVEILSIYHDSAESDEDELASGGRSGKEMRLLREYAETQLRELASSPQLAARASELDPKSLSEAFLSRGEPVARLSALAVMLEPPRPGG